MVKDEMLSEARIIDFFKQQFPALGGIGDDAAVLPLSDTESYVISKDLLLEGVHFRHQYFDDESLAHKALHVNLSDIAVMGAVPRYVLLGLAIPQDNNIDKFLASFAQHCKTCDVTLIGGDTTKSENGLCISVTAIGIAQKSNIKLRSTARVGNIVCIAGKLGYAHVGLQALERSTPGLEAFKEALMRPKARIQEGLWFGAKASVTSMMDISDGLFIDLQRLCQASKVEAKIETEQLPVAQDFLDACKVLELEPLQVQLTGGEDYGLLVTIDSNEYTAVAAEFFNLFGYPLLKVARISTTGVQNTLTLKPFSHFGEL